VGKEGQDLNDADPGPPDLEREPDVSLDVPCRLIRVDGAEALLLRAHRRYF
jgi:hypothetical protein